MKRNTMFLQSQLAEAVGRYAPALDCAYLFGSQARGNAGPLSDVDIGLLFSEAVPGARREEIQFELISRLQKVNGPPIDAVILNDAPPFLRHQVIRDGRDPDLYGSAERFLHLAIEAVFDMGNHCLAGLGLRPPDQYGDTCRPWRKLE